MKQKMRKMKTLKMYRNKRGAVTGSVLSIILAGVLVLTVGAFIYTNSRINQKNLILKDITETKEDLAKVYYQTNDMNQAISYVKNNLSSKYHSNFNIKETQTVSTDSYNEYRIDIDIKGQKDFIEIGGSD